MIKEIRKITAIIIAFVSLVNISNASPKDTTPKVDATDKVYDFAELLSDSEENELYGDIINFTENYNLDAVVVTINYNSKSSAKDYADDFYDYNDFGVGQTNDGILFLIDMDNREMWMSTTGTAQLIYDDYRIDKILDATYDKIADEDYYGCASAFIEKSSYYASLGIPSSNENSYVDENGDYHSNSNRDTNYTSVHIANFKLALIVAGIVTLIFALIAFSKHRMIKRATEAKQYLKNFKISKKNDVFLHTNTTSRYIPPADDSSSGGSSTHSGSSGVSHGGGGRSF